MKYKAYKKSLSKNTFTSTSQPSFPVETKFLLLIINDYEDLFFTGFESVFGLSELVFSVKETINYKVPDV